MSLQNVKIEPEQHISYRDTVLEIRGCGDGQLVRRWYDDLPLQIKDKIDNCGFKQLIEGVSNSETDCALIQALAEKWWDSTHTFHFDNLGEMTITPTDFSSITGIPVIGKPLKLDKQIHRNKKCLLKYLGEPMMNHSSCSLDIVWIYETYKHRQSKNNKEEDIIVRAFLIALLGSTLFARPNNKVDLCYLPMLKILADVGEYNWGGAALAFMYQQMDDICRHNARKIGGMWRAWEVWAHEYLPCIQLVQPQDVRPVFPRLNKWMHSEHIKWDKTNKLQFYRQKLTMLLFNQVCWSPWGEESNLPIYAKQSFTATKKRILLHGSEGATWYLGERVTVQSLGCNGYLIPKNPPKSMLTKDRLTLEPDEWIEGGESAYKFIYESKTMNYEEYRNIYVNSISNKYIQHLGNPPNRDMSNQGLQRQEEEDLIPMPPWTLLIPSTEGSPNVICIPTDVDIENFEIPPHVKQVNVLTAQKLLRMIAGMQQVVIEQITSASETLRHYAAIIQNMQTQLDLKCEKIAALTKIVEENRHLTNVHDNETTTAKMDSYAPNSTADVDRIDFFG